MEVDLVEAVHVDGEGAAVGSEAELEAVADQFRLQTVGGRRAEGQRADRHGLLAPLAQVVDGLDLEAGILVVDQRLDEPGGDLRQLEDPAQSVDDLWTLGVGGLDVDAEAPLALATALVASGVQLTQTPQDADVRGHAFVVPATLVLRIERRDGQLDLGDELRLSREHRQRLLAWGVAHRPVGDDVQRLSEDAEPSVGHGCHIVGDTVFGAEVVQRVADAPAVDRPEVGEVHAVHGSADEL